MSDAAPRSTPAHSWGPTEFVPGGDAGIVGPRTVALVAGEGRETRDRLWGLLASDATLDEILDALSASGFASLPDFGLAQIEADGVRVIVRGRAAVEVVDGDGDVRRFDATGVRTWVEALAGRIDAVTITLSAATDRTDGDRYHVLAGSVPASAITRRFDVADPHAGAAVDAGWPEVAGAATDDHTAEPAPLDPPSPAPVATSVPAPPKPAGGEAGSEPAAPEPAVPAPDVTAPDVADPDVEPVVDEPVAQDAAVDAPDAEVAEDGVAEIVFDEPAPALADQSEVGDHDADADRATDPLSGDDGSEAVAVLSFSHGEVVPVDRSVLIGRNPKVADDIAPPRIVRFEGPSQGLSRTHAEVRIEDGELVVEDLQSTNGTEIQLPGAERQRLAGGEPALIVVGTLIDFGDELSCTVDAAPTDDA